MTSKARPSRSRFLLVTALAAAMAAPAACFRKSKKGATLLAADESGSGPKPFSIDQPIVPISAEPALLSWRPSAGATSYAAVIATTPGCAGAVFQQLGLLEHQMTAPGLAEGSYYLCVTAEDDLGRARSADNDSATFSIDRSPPRASVAAPPSELDVPAVVTVGGEGVVGFVYKAGRSEEVDCAAPAGYSNELPVKAPLAVGLSDAKPGEAWTLCLLGLDLAGNRQSAAEATRVEWHTNAVGRKFTLDLPTVVGETALEDGQLEVTGSAPRGWTTVQRVSASVRHVASGTCYDGAEFAATCPTWLPARGTSPWSLPLPAGALTEADVYEVTVQAQDAERGLLSDAGGGRFAWRFGRVELAGDGHQVITHAVRAAGGATVLAVELDGAIASGAVRIPRLDPSTPDWLIMRQRGDGSYDWVQSFRGAGEDRPRAVALGADESVYVIGTADQQLTIGETTLGGKGGRDMVFAKLSARDGAPLWARSVGTSRDDEAGGIQVDAAGNVVVFGDFCDEATDFGDGAPVTPEGCAFYVAKYGSKDGALLWVRTFDTKGWTRPTALAPYGEDGWLITGELGGEVTFGADTLKPAEGGESVGVVARLDTDGQALWGKSLLGPGRQMLSGAARAPDGGILVGGHGSRAEQVLAGRPVEGRADARNLVIAKLDASGQLLWGRTATAKGDWADAFDIACDSGGDAYLLARSHGSVSFAELKVDLATAGGSDILFASFDGDDGALRTARFFGSDADDVLTSPRLSRTVDGHILFPVAAWNEVRFGSAKVPDESDTASLLVEFAP
jgi:hypothetical protein